MISYIVIGRNEEKNLRLCFNSIYDTIQFNGITHYEIIYVDSKSTDQSINIVREFPEIKIITITGSANAAVGRNVGAKMSHGNILYFIDADMEINREFLSIVLDKEGNLKYKIVSGQVLDIVNGKKKLRYAAEFLGGIFLIQRPVWETVHGMRTKYKKGQDMDLGLRLFKEGISLTRKSDVITNHYTVHGMDKVKIWKMVLNRSSFYARAVLYRDHIFNKQMYRLLWKNDKTSALLLILLITSLANPGNSFYYLLVYLTAILFRSIKQIKVISLAECICYHIVSDTLNVFNAFTFYPTAIKEEYTLLNQNMLHER